MAYQLKAGEPVGDAVIRIARQQLRRAVAEIDDVELDRHATVHQVRKRCKKVRGLLRLVRPALGATYAHENACIREAAGQLSHVRDAQTRVETFDGLVSHFGSALDQDFVAQVRARLVARRSEVVDDETDLDDRLRRVRLALQEADARSGHWQLDEEGFAAIAGGVEKTCRRGRKAMAAAYETPTAETFHTWRKRTKYYGFQLRLLRPLWPAVFKAQGDAASRLGDLLGDDHDLAVLAATLEHELAHELEQEQEQEQAPLGTDGAVEALFALIQQRRLTLQQQARPLGERLFAESPGALIARFERCWGAWQREQRTARDDSSR